MQIGTTTMKLLFLFLLVILAGCAHDNTPARTSALAPAKTAATPGSFAPKIATAEQAERIRTDCINGRRLICGKVLKVLPDGLVVDSGYTDLLRPPLTQSWVISGTVSARRNPTVLELKTPGTPCVGWIFLTDIPKRQKVKNFDYVVMMGYPAGTYVYTPAPNVKKTIRKFSAGLDTAVRLICQAAESFPKGPPTQRP